jgi:uncharacterized protein YndB with AHSA1/START domain
MRNRHPEPTTFDRTVFVDASTHAVWRALTDPQLTKLYVGAMPMTDWKVGQPIRWCARQDDGGMALKAKGVIMACQPDRRLRYTHYPLDSKLPDEAASHTTVDIRLEEEADGRTRVTLWQGDYAGLPNAGRRAREAGRLWTEVMVGLKRVSEEVSREKAA